MGHGTGRGNLWVCMLSTSWYDFTLMDIIRARKQNSEV